MADPNVKFYKGEIVGVSGCPTCRHRIDAICGELSYQTSWMGCSGIHAGAFPAHIGLTSRYFLRELISLEDPFDKWVRDVRRNANVGTDVAR